MSIDTETGAGRPHGWRVLVVLRDSGVRHFRVTDGGGRRYEVRHDVIRNRWVVISHRANRSLDPYSRLGAQIIDLVEDYEREVLES